ncbi:hypothetical protein [Tsukamurella tyrosinosolvens]|uniref:hypothetical protein n=1 Tax=Tsukamurella tyrosinosolvens TaxID=57704 RepID=UPI000DF6CA3D|nr:hypothetical protein [Tsukamurella tyrosinosolvens]RDB46822.1 hypothetical protein DVB87_16375 [Tsukamurella tyrosinosolvens]
MTDNTPERDVPAVQRELRIKRAVIALVVHGYRGDTLGYNDALTDLLVVDHATLAEIQSTLLWALSRLPRSLDDPTALTDMLAGLHWVPDGEVPDA